MNETFERIEKGLYRRQYKTDGGCSTLYYARFTCKLKRKRRLIPLGSDLEKARKELKRIEVQNIDDFDFDSIISARSEKTRKASPFTFSEWAQKYPSFDDVKRKRSLDDDVRMIRLHLEPFFSRCLLTAIEREVICRYIDRRTAQSLIRGKKGQSSKIVSRGTVSNKLSLLRHMLKVARREGYAASNPSFEGMIIRTEKKPRALTLDEQKSVLEIYPMWMARLSEFAAETCLSQGDLLRLTDHEIDIELGVIVPEGGRKKTGAEQIAPLTPRAREILEEIRAEKKSGAIILNVNGLVFTRADGRPITKNMIQTQVERAIKLGSIKKFVFHNYRATALTEWARRGYPVDVAMRAAGHTSQQVRDRYLDLQKEDIAAVFGTAQNPKSGNASGNKLKSLSEGWVSG